MGRFLAFLLVFIIGAVIGVVGGGFIGAAGGAYVGSCKVIDTAVANGSMTQDQANSLLKSIAADIGVKPEDKQRIIDALKKSDQPPSACVTAIQAL